MEWSSLTFENVKLMLRDFARQRNWNQYHTPRNLALALIGEVGELAECFQWRTEEDCEGQLKGFTREEKIHVGEELSDVFLYLCRLADRCQYHLPDAVSAKIALNAKKYPVQLSKGSANKYHTYSSETGVEWNNQSMDQAIPICSPEQSWGNMTLETLRARLGDFVAARDWGALHRPRNLALALAGEAGELAELWQWRPEAAAAARAKEGEERKEETAAAAGFLADWNDADKIELSQEISDVLIYLIRLSDVCGIDLSRAVLDKMAKNAAKYPASQVHGKWEKYTQYNNNKQKNYTFSEAEGDAQVGDPGSKQNNGGGASNKQNNDAPCRRGCQSLTRIGIAYAVGVLSTLVMARLLLSPDHSSEKRGP